MKTRLIDALISLIGAVGTFYPFQAMENFWVGLLIGLFAALIAALIIWKIIRKAREITIPEALAYGYFGSFLEPLVAGTVREAVLEEKGKEKHYPGAKVHFNIVIPENIDMLGEAFDTLATTHRSGALIVDTQTKPLGVYLKNDKDGIIVTDVPNNLRTLKTYMKRLRNTRAAGKKWFAKKSETQKGLEEYKKALDQMINEHKDLSDALRRKVTIVKQV